MKPTLLSTVALGALLALAATRPASADPLFTGSTWDDVSVCRSSTVYPYDELRACERALDDLSADSDAATNQVDRQNVDLMMAEVGVVTGFLYQELSVAGADGMFSSSRSLLQTIRTHAVSAEIADRADAILAMMDKDGI